VSSPAILTLMVVLFLTLGYLGVPVAFALLAGVLVGTLFTDVTLTSIITQMFNGVDATALLAVPFFLLVGELMTSANVVIRIADLSQALVGHFRGGLAQVVTVFSMFFSGISGSSSADVAVLSRTLAKPMAQEGYTPEFVAALIAAGSTIAALPGLMIGFGLMTYCYFFGPEGFRRPRARFRQVTCAAADAALPLMIPVILLGGITTGWFTPTEAGVVAVAWILLVVIPSLNRAHWRELPIDFCHAGLIYALPLITIAAAQSFGFMLAYLRGPIVVSGWIAGLAGNDPNLVMFLLVLVFVIVGDFIEPIPAVIIFMPVVKELTAAADINDVHMGVVLIATLAFGLITPPYGLALLMSSKFVGVRFAAALRASLAIYVVFFLTIAFTIFFPNVILWLPKHTVPESVGCFKAPGGSGYVCP